MEHNDIVAEMGYIKFSSDECITVSFQYGFEINHQISCLIIDRRATSARDIPLTDTDIDDMITYLSYYRMRKIQEGIWNV